MLLSFVLKEANFNFKKWIIAWRVYSINKEKTFAFLENNINNILPSKDVVDICLHTL